MPSRHRKPLVPVFLGLVLAMTLQACSPGPRLLRLEVLPPLEGRLAAILERHPLPRGWSATFDADPRQSLGLSLSWRYAAAAGKEDGGVILDRDWLAPSVDFLDPRLDLSGDEAVALGLSSLDSIELPMRAVAVEGKLPGDSGYPFERDLVLGINGRPSRLPPALAAWLAAVAAGEGGSGGEEPLRLGAVGDIQVGPDEGPWLAQGQEGLKRLFGSALPLLSRDDVLVGNLEGPVTDRGPANPRKRFVFSFPPGATASLKAAGFDLFLFANNHGLDHGLQGFEDSFKDAKAGGVPLAGAGMDLKEALEPRYATRSASGKGSRLAFIGYAFFPTERMGFSMAEAGAGAASPGINNDLEATVAAIGAARARGDVVVVLAHGGAEYRYEPTREAVATYRRFIEAGASLVLGSHPHLLQGAEAWKGGLIAYSLGNFLFTGEAEPPAAFRSALLRVLYYKGKPRALALEPVLAELRGTSLDPDPSATRRAFMERSAALAGGKG
jgi:poly-gamma-glutamate synthesis protein (capsule biosynthesis protein)